MELFGKCSLTIQDIAYAEAFGYSESNLLLEAAWEYYRKEQNNFSAVLENWSKGNKLQITLEEAEKRDQYYDNAEAILIDADEPIDGDCPGYWVAFPKDKAEICFYQGLPFDSELCVWAENYINNKKSNA